MKNVTKYWMLTDYKYKNKYLCKHGGVLEVNWGDEIFTFISFEIKKKMFWLHLRLAQIAWPRIEPTSQQ